MLYNRDIVQKDMEELYSIGDFEYDKFDGKTVLITGATGMLAYYVTCFLMYLNIQKKRNIRVVALVRSKEKAKQKFRDFFKDSRFVLLNQDVCQPIEYKGNVDYIFHAAGGASPRVIKSDPLGIIRANIHGTMNVMEFARYNNVKKVVYPSTREVYGAMKGTGSINETMMGVTDQLESRACYPESKRMAEQILKSYHVLYKIPITILRIAHVYGPGMDIDDDGRVMSDFISDIVNNRNVVLKSTGEAERAFCYLLDAVRAVFMTMLMEESFGVYNVANETEPMMIKDVAKMLVDMYPERGLKVVFEANNDTSGYCKFERVGLDTRKLMEIGWEPKISLKEGLKRTVQSF